MAHRECEGSAPSACRAAYAHGHTDPPPTPGPTRRRSATAGVRNVPDLRGRTRGRPRETPGRRVDLHGRSAMIDHDGSADRPLESVAGLAVDVEGRTRTSPGTVSRMNDRMVWIDCEMTGLDLERDALVE